MRMHDPIVNGDGHMKNVCRIGLVLLWMGTIVPWSGDRLHAQPVSEVTYGYERQMSQWIFGNSSDYVRFNRISGAPEKLTGRALPFSIGGSVSVSDPVNGDLLFYSNGNRILDRSHRVMPLGNGLTASSGANQPVVACDVPGQPGKYFLFTNDATTSAGGTVRYTVVDMNQFGNSNAPAPPMGDVEASRKNLPVPGLTGISEGMIVIPNQDGNGYWLLTHRFGTSEVMATAVDASAYSSGLFLQVPSALTAPFTAAAHWAWHPVTGLLAAVSSASGQNALILSIDRGTGAVTLQQIIPNSAATSTNGQALFDAEWSPEGRYLYLSVHGDESIGRQGSILQFDRNDPAVSLAPVQPAGFFRSFGLQRANDTAVYHLYQSALNGPVRIGRLSRMDTVATAVRYEPLPFGAQDWVARQFPAQVPPPILTLDVSFTSAGNCQQSPVVFFPTVVPGADSVVWDFGDGGFSDSWSPRHVYSQGNSFPVTLTAFLGGRSASVTNTVTLQNFQLSINVTSDTTACRSEFPAPRGSSSPVQFKVEAKVNGGTHASAIWSNGDTGLILTPDSAGYYYLVVSDASGCSAYAGVNVKEYDLQDQRSNVWYFGNKAGIDFNKQPPVALDDGAMNAPEGCAVVGDRNGKVIFYTDGDKVYNREHTEIATGLGGNPQSTQSAVIVPIPGDETLYYIFTTEANILGSGYTAYYALFDLKRNNGLGEVVTQRNVLFTRSTERLTASPSWLVAHEFGNNSFRTYRITPNGIGAPVISSIGSDHVFDPPAQSEGYMRLGPRNNLAVALSNPGLSNVVEVFHLVDSSGVVTDFRRVDLAVPDGQVYGLEFSPGGNKLFATVSGPPSLVAEMSLDSLERISLKQKVSGPGKLGAIQRAPDGQLYIAIDGSSTLGSVLVNEDTTQLSSFNFAAFALASGTNSRLGLPNFIFQTGNAFGGPSLAFSGICLGAPTIFLGNKTDPIDNFLWALGDGTGSTADTIRHVYALPKTYTVSLNVRNRCGLDTTLVQTVRIFEPPKQPTIPGAIALCSAPITLDADSLAAPGIRYRWSTGDTTRTVTTDIPGAFRVVMTDPVSQCVTQGSSLVVDNRPIVDLGSDLTVCQNTPLPTLDAQNPGAQFAWTLNGAAPSGSQRYPVNTSAFGLFEYKVRVTDPVTGCFRRDSVRYTINETPSFTLSAMNSDADCNTNSGSITIDIAPATVLLSYRLEGPSIRSAGPLNSGSYVEPDLSAGSYVVTVGSETSRCGTTRTIGITETSFTVTVPDAATCTTSPLTVTTSAAGSYTLTVLGSSGVVGAPVTRTGSPVQTTALPPGIYTVEVAQGICKVTASEIEVTQSDPVQVSADLTDRCLASPQLTASSPDGSATFQWSGPAGTVSTPTSAATRVTPPVGSSIYKVTASAPGFCPASDSLTVFNENLAGKVSITPSDVCQPTVVLSATAPSGPYTFRWYRNNALDLAFLGSEISVDSTFNGQVFRVELFSSATGCPYPSDDETVEVVGKVTAAVSAEQACQDNKPVTITATTNKSGASFAWSLNGTNIPGAVSDTLRRRPEGSYRVTVSRLTCSATAEIGIVRAPIPIGKLPSGAVICAEPLNPNEETRRIKLDPGEFVSYKWFKNDIEQGSTDREFVADSPGLYRVDLVNSFDCKASDETEVLNDCIPLIVTPNIFRPFSGIADNQEFRMFSLFIEDAFKISIFNRWGELIYQSDQRDFSWNGGYDNDASRPAPGGTYAWVIEYVSSFRPQEGFQTRRGGVVLLR